MSTVLLLACLWVLAATLTALLPMRRQILPGLVLLLLAPVLIVALGRDYGALAAAAALAAFLSMFRRPIVHLVRHALGRPARRPEGEGRHE